MVMPPAPGRAATSFPFLIALEALHIIGCTARPSRFRRLTFLPVPLLVFYILSYTTAGKISDDLALGVTAACYLLSASDYFLLTDIQNTFVKLSSPKYCTNPEKSKREEKEGRGKIAKEGVWKRLYWTLTLRIPGRALGWGHEAPIPQTHQHTFLFFAPPSQKRGLKARIYFVFSRLQQVALTVLALDAVVYFWKQAIVEPWNGQVNASAQRLLMAFLRNFWALQYILTTFLNLQLVHSVLSIVCVGIGLSDPEEWPPLFGQWREAYTVRRFWG